MIFSSLRTGRIRRGVFVGLVGLLALVGARAQTTTLHTFTGGMTDGTSPSTGLMQAADGTIYGVTAQGGASNNGTVYRIQPDGSGYGLVVSIPSGSGSPAVPGWSFLLGQDGVFYGTSEFGGTSTFGSLYKVNRDGTGFAVVRSFTAGGPNVINDGGAPRGGLVHASDGFLYGCASTGTSAGTAIADRNGVIYRIAPDGSGYRLVFSFDGGSARLNGNAPVTLIEGRDGRLYGTTLGGGTDNGSFGVAFALNKDGTGFAVLHSFGNTSPNGSSPESPLVHAADGYLYGASRSGGGAGNVYRMLPDGSAFSIVYQFPFSSSTANPNSPKGAFFQGRDGSLYGAATRGGTSNGGVIYKVRTDGTGFRVIANLPSSSPYFPGLLQGQDGALYATTNTSILRIVEPPGIEITAQPRSQTITPGGSVTFNVTAPLAISYQWRRNGTAIAGATAASYTLNNLTTAANATYTVLVSNTSDSVASAGAVLLVAVPNPGRLINLSVRTNAGTGAQTLIAGFVVGGTGSKQVLVRAIGPALTQFGVPGALADPRLGLFDSGSFEIANNSGWGGTTSLTNAFALVGAFPLTAASRDAALLSTLPAGGYSAQAASSSGGTGVALVEAYDADPGTPSARFINLSARTVAGTGAQTLIAGFVLSGNVPKTFLIRGVGPGLNQFGVTGTLANPRLELHTTVNSADTTVASNAGWAGASALSAAFAQVGAFALPPTSADAALLITLTPGSYTAQVTGAGGTTGVALVEIYEVP